MELRELGRMLNIEIKGEGDYVIEGIRDIERLPFDQAPQEHFLYFVESMNVLKRHPRSAEHGAVLTIRKLAEKFNRALIAPDADIRLILINLLKYFDKAPAFKPGVSPQAHIHPSARVDETAAVLAGAAVMEGATIGAQCTIYPGVVIEPYAEIGEGSVLYPCVVIGHHCRVGRRCLIHGGTVIGADGFGFHDQSGQRHKIPQIGNVVIDDDVEIGAGCTVDRATIESTTIGAQTKIDDQVHIGHNCRIGRFIYIVGNTAVGGSVVIEDGAMISGMVIIKDHLRIAQGSIIMGMSGVAQDTEPKLAYFGTPARPARQMHKMNAALERLPELLVRVRELDDKISRIESAAVSGPGA